MPTIHYVQIAAKNILLSIIAFLIINLLLIDALKEAQIYQNIFAHSLIFGVLVGMAAATNEALIERDIKKKAEHKHLLLEKLQLTSVPLYYIRLIRVFLMGCVLCLTLIALTSLFDVYPLGVYMQLSVIPVCLALGANVPQTYTLYIRLDENRQEVLDVVQQTLQDSIFEVEFKDRHHLVYKLASQWQHLYAYCFAPDRCTIEMLVHRDYVALTGAYRYLDAMMDDEYISLITTPREQEEKKERVA